jgi:hypothetical protein
MTDQTQATLAKQTVSTEKIRVSKDDRKILRRLAHKVAEHAERPIEDKKRELWYSHNALETTFSLIFCDPENGWNEIITDDQKECSSDLARDWEMVLRKEILWGE